MPVRPCLEPGCPNYVRDARSKGRCDEHYRALERNRSRSRREDAKQRNRLYARKKWRMTRRRKLYETPLCELEFDGCLGIASEVHHRVPLEQGGAPYHPANLVSACKPCHSAETRREQRGRAVRRDLAGR
jgi:5-methylcytosine-specific restriction enzyme A